MFPKHKVTRISRQDEGTPSRHPRLGTRAAALMVLGSGMVGIWSAPMAYAADHDSLKTFRSSSTFTVTKDDADVDATDDRTDSKDDADVDATDDRADSKDDADIDATDDRTGFKDEADDDAYDLWDFDGLRITVIVNNNNNNNNGTNANNNNNNNNDGGTKNNNS